MILILLPIVFCQQVFNSTLTVGRHINISFGDEFIFGFKTENEISYNESQVVLEDANFLEGSFINAYVNRSNTVALHKNCTLEIFFLSKSISQQNFQEGCIQMYFAQNLNDVLIFYPKEIMIYSLGNDFSFKINYKHPNNINEVRMFHQYILISKDDGLDLLNYNGELILHNFISKTKIISSEMQLSRLIVLTEEGLCFFNGISNPQLQQIIKIQNGKKLIALNNFVYVQTTNQILEYIDQKLNQIIECKSDDFAIYSNFLYYIENDQIYIKTISIKQDFYNVNKIKTFSFPTNQKKITGFSENLVYLGSEQGIQVYKQSTRKAYAIYEGKNKGKYQLNIELFVKNCSEQLRACSKQVQINLTIIDSLTWIDGVMYGGIITLCLMFVILVFYLIKRTYLKLKLGYSEVINEQQPTSDQIIINK